MPVNTSIDTANWDYGQRRPRFENWSDVVRAYSQSFPQTFTSSLGVMPGAQGGAGGQSQRFWREILPKDEALNRQYESLRGMMPGMTLANLGAIGQYQQAFNRVTPQVGRLNQQQINAAMAPFTGQLSESLGQARQEWAGAAGQQADAAREELRRALGEWNVGKQSGFAALRDALGRQLAESTAALNRQLQQAYTQESALNRDYAAARDRLAQINQNRAMNQLIAAVAPGMGSAMSDFTTRAAMRMAQEAAAQDAAAVNQMQRDSLLRRLAGEMGVLERKTGLERGDIQDLSRLGLAQSDAYYQQLANLAAMDDARRRQIIDQILGSGRLSDIGYVTSAQSQMFGRPQALLSAEAQNYLAPVQARQSWLATELGMVPRAADALHAANWLAVGTSGNQGGYPVYAAPPPLPPIRDFIGPYYSSLADSLGYYSAVNSPVAQSLSRMANERLLPDYARDLLEPMPSRIYA